MNGFTTSLAAERKNVGGNFGWDTWHCKYEKKDFDVMA